MIITESIIVLEKQLNIFYILEKRKN